MPTLLGRQAVVVGAGMGGLTAARALADHFEHVLILERDALPTHATHRAGTPQDRHVHALLGGGQRSLADLFPGFERDLAAAGAVPYRAGFDLRVERPGFDPFPQRDLGWVGYAMSRPLIEFTVRRHVQQYKNITLRQACRVKGLVATTDGGGVTGVEYETETGGSETLATDLVIDASGRGAPTLALLKSLGQPLPEEALIGVDISYATAVFDIPDHSPGDWKGVMTFPHAPQSSRWGLLMPQEGRRWILSAGGARAETPPVNASAYLEYLHGLRTPTIYNAVKHATLVGEVVRYAFPESVWRRFDRLASFPRGLVPMADALCRFNPTYGQGMSVAAQQACLIRRLLGARRTERDPLAALAPSFFAEARGIVEAPWAAASLDFIYPQTRGHRPPDFQRTVDFGRALTRLAASDPAIHRLVIEVQHLLKPRSAYRELADKVMAMVAAA